MHMGRSGSKGRGENQSWLGGEENGRPKNLTLSNIKKIVKFKIFC